MDRVVSKRTGYWWRIRRTSEEQAACGGQYAYEDPSARSLDADPIRPAPKKAVCFALRCPHRVAGPTHEIKRLNLAGLTG